MTLVPAIHSSNSDPYSSSGVLDYTDDTDTGNLSDLSTSTDLSVLMGSSDFDEQVQTSEAGPGLHLQGTEVTFPPAQSVCFLLLLDRLSVRLSKAIWPASAGLRYV